MRVGVVILPQYRWPEARARWRSLQDRGFAHGWTYDHLAWRDLADEPWFGTVPTLTAAATVTDRLRLGTWVTSPNFRHPVTLAKDLMTLDDISGGRMIAAIGAGGIGWDATVLGRAVLSPRERVDRLDEFVTLTDLLLTQPDTTWQGTYFRAERARMVPAGSRARIPLVVAANGRRTIDIAARADGWATTGPESTDIGTEAWWAAVSSLVETFEAAARAAGRDPEAMDRYLNLDSAPVLSVSSIDAFTDAAGRAAALGFTDAVIHWPRPAGIYAGDEAVLDRIADLLTGGKPVMNLELVAIIVKDYDPAIEFFVGVLGFELIEDSLATTNAGRPKRWVVVRPPGAQSGILLAKADGPAQTDAVGNQFAGRVGFFLRVDDFDASLQRMIAAGVEFVGPPRDEPYGRVAVFRDLAGNRWDLLGPARHHPALDHSESAADEGTAAR